MCGTGSESVCMCVCVGVCVQKAKVVCTEGVTTRSCLPAALCKPLQENNVMAPDSLLKAPPTLEPLPPCCVLGQHTSEHTHTHNAALSGAGERSTLTGSLSATGTNSAGWLFAVITSKFLFSSEHFRCVLSLPSCVFVF